MCTTMAKFPRTCFSLAFIILGLMMQDFANAQAIEVDVAYFYTTSVKNKYADIEADLIDKIDAQLNTIFLLGGALSVEFNVAGHREITLSGPNPVNETDLLLHDAAKLSHSQNPADRLKTSAGESIAAIRYALKADIVYVIYDQDKVAFSGGHAGEQVNLPTHPFPWPEVYLVTISDEAAISNRYISAHGMGHVLGCRHPRGTGPGTDNNTVPFPKCHGYVFAEGQYGTIMTNFETCPPPNCNRIPFFSNKNEDYIDVK